MPMSRLSIPGKNHLQEFYGLELNAKFGSQDSVF